MQFYHGTDEKSGNLIEGPPPNVNVTFGGGELGRGFYVGDTISLAISWAKGRYPKPALLEFDINNKQYALLALKQMSHRNVLSTWQQLKRLKTHRTFTFGYDVVFGPLATAPYAGQYKFESITGQNLLNTSTINRIL